MKNLQGNIRRCFLLALIFLCLCPGLQAQDSIRAEAYLTQAKASAIPDSQLHYYSLAAASFKSAGLQTAWVGALKQKAKVQWGEGRFQEALDIYKLILDESWEEDPKTEGSTWMLLGYYQQRMGEYLKALESYERARAVFEKSPPVSGRNAYYVYRPLGQIYTRIGEYEKAINLLRQAADLCEADSNFKPQPSIYSDLGLAYRFLGKYDKALASFEEGLSKRGLRDRDELLLRENMAENLLHRSQISAARKQITLCRPLLNGQTPQPYRVGFHSINAGVLIEENRLAQASAEFSNAIRLHIGVFGVHNRELGKLYLAYADLLGKQGQALSGIGYCQKALQCVLPGFMPTGESDNPEVNSLYSENLIIEALHAKASLWQLQFELSDDRPDLELALTCSELGLLTERKFRGMYSYQSSQLQLSEDSHAAHESGIRAAFALHKLSGDTAYLERAFQIAEDNKAIVLRQSLRESRARQALQLPDSMSELETSLQREMDLCRLRIFEAQQARESDADWSQRYFAAKESYDSLQQVLRKRHPGFGRVWEDNATLRTDTILSYLANRDAMLIELFVGEEQIFVFSLTGEGISGHSVALDLPWLSRFEALIFNLQHAPEDADTAFDQFVRLSRGLYRELLAPATATWQDFKELIVVPDGRLQYLPIEILLSEDVRDDARDYRSLPYLIRQFPIRYQFSAQFLLSDADQQGSSGEGLAGFAPRFEGDGGGSHTVVNNYPGARSSFQALTHNIHEVEEISAMWGGDSYLGNSASEAIFKDRAPHYQILHLATHAFILDDDPDFSGLVLSPTTETNENNAAGILHAYEVYGMELKADLAVLSACNTASGKIYRGEGAMSLSRAFRYAGCPNLLTSLWRADDESTYLIMISFYQLLLEGKPLADAIRLAKLEYLANSAPDRAAPFFWSTFVLQGENVLQQPERYTPIWLWVLMGMAGLGIVALLVRLFWRGRTRT